MSINDISFEEEKRINNPLLTFQWPVENYRLSLDADGEGMYEWEEIYFYNTSIIQEAARHFQKNKVYTDIDPVYDADEYQAFWDREEYRRRYGITVPIRGDRTGGNSDKDLKLLWVPGEMYGHLNYGPISKPKTEDDISLEDYAKMSASQKEKRMKDDELSKLFEGLATKEFRESTYDFPDFWDGHFHTWVSMLVAQRLGKNIGVAKSRRKGFSYLGGWKCFNCYDTIPNSNCYLVAFDAEKYLCQKGGLFDMVKRYSNFINQNTDWSKERLVDTSYSIQSGRKIVDTGATIGYLSSITCLSANNNPDCLRGKNGRLVFWEELGKFSNFPETFDAASSAMESGEFKVGQSIFWGTVGIEESDYTGLMDLAYNPLKYDCLRFKKKWGSTKTRTSMCLWFGQYQNSIGSMDEHGNSDYEKAEKVFKILEEKARREKSPDQFKRWLGERARTPEEAFSDSSNNIFSRWSDTISNQLYLLEHDEKLKNFGNAGRYIKDGNKVVFKKNSELEELGLKVYPHISSDLLDLPRGFNMHGCIMEYYQPYVSSEGIIPTGLYDAIHDPYATDKFSKEITQQHSLGVTYIIERINNYTETRGGRIMASWIGRPETTDEYNDQLFMMLERWNAKLMFENDRGEVISYAKRYHLTGRLHEEPEMLSLKAIAGLTGRNFGVSIQKHAERKATGALMFRDYLGRTVGSNGDESVLFIQTVFCRMLLKQIQRWRPDGNFDAVSAWIVGMYLIRENMDKITEGHTELYDTFFLKERRVNSRNLLFEPMKRITRNTRTNRLF